MELNHTGICLVLNEQHWCQSSLQRRSLTKVHILNPSFEQSNGLDDKLSSGAVTELPLRRATELGRADLHSGNNTSNLQWRISHVETERNQCHLLIEFTSVKRKSATFCLLQKSRPNDMHLRFCIWNLWKKQILFPSSLT